MPTYCLIDNLEEMPRWCELVSTEEGELVWMDFKSRSIDHSVGKVLGHVYGQHINEAMSKVPDTLANVEKDFAYQYLLDPWSNQGWVSPDGKFWGCSFFGHDDIAYALIRKSPGSLEDEGWVRVHSDFFRIEDSIRGLTKRQETTLEKLGFYDLYNRSRTPRFTIDREAPAPRYAVKPPQHIADRPKSRKVVEAAIAETAPSLEPLICHLKSFNELAELFEQAFEEIPEVGPGTWEWMMQWQNISIGSEESVAELTSSQGLRLAKTSFDTMELMTWPECGLIIDDQASKMLEMQLNENRPTHAM